MNTKENIKEFINDAVLNGKLPLAFLNSQVTSIDRIDNDRLKILNKKYLQKNLPDAESPILISKIYDLF
ncbi:MAG: hypothetical protein PHW88_05660 [Bacteroidales bacterium]|jgi:hypothetical protein|nr:hypothetical protein [Bacteroidales bacterium]MDD2771236.1 hypothetical protein [Bacteroidales bacterium]MDD3105085.1 hypothetical protein [Bacteroidales bacterium]MDD3549927.1 hypothetical protein [Bacteroidales bacterium]MDY0182306.1 hypothetical protein [Proteiniphilum sp.]